MGQAVTETVVALPRDQIWAKLRDLTAAQYYVPGVQRITFNTDQREGVGASRKVFMGGGRGSFDETVTAWEDGHGFTIRLHKGDKAPPPFKTVQFTYALDDAGPGETRFRGTLTYTLPGGFFGKMVDFLFFHRLARIGNDVIGANFKRYMETGERANEAP